MLSIQPKDICNAVVHCDNMVPGKFNFAHTNEHLSNIRDGRRFTAQGVFDSLGCEEEFEKMILEQFEKAPFDAVGFILIHPDGRVSHLELIQSVTN